MEIRIGIPNRGRISALCCELFNHNFNTSISIEERVMVYTIRDKYENEIEIVLLRSTDIPKMLEEKNIDMGITGNDYFIESGANIIESNNLFMFNGMLCMLAKRHSGINSIYDFKRKEDIIFCSQYPNIGYELMRQLDSNFVLKKIDGAAESYLKLNLCEIVIDVVTSGSTFVKNDLKIISPIFPVSTHIYFSSEYVNAYYDFCSEIVYQLCGRDPVFFNREESITYRKYIEFKRNICSKKEGLK